MEKKIIQYSSTKLTIHTVLNRPYMYSNGYHSTPLLKILQLMTKQAFALIVLSKLNL